MWIDVLLVVGVLWCLRVFFVVVCVGVGGRFVELWKLIVLWLFICFFDFVVDLFVFVVYVFVFVWIGMVKMVDIGGDLVDFLFVDFGNGEFCWCLDGECDFFGSFDYYWVVVF